MMKSNTKLRLLSGFAFLLLLAPFYNSCNGKYFFSKDVAKTEEPTATEVPLIGEGIDSTFVKDTISNQKDISVTDTIAKAIEVPFYQKTYEFIDDGDTENAIELAGHLPNLLGGIFEKPFKETIIECKEGIRERNFSGLSLIIASLCFVIIVINTFIVLCLTSFKRLRLIYKLTIISLICVSISLVCIVFFVPFFETYKQIKWGYYAFIITQLLILRFSKKQ